MEVGTPPTVRRSYIVNHSLLRHMVSPKGILGSTKIASFDMDGTLITTKSGKVHPESRVDWKWLSSKVKPTLISYYNQGYKLVIFTNQAGVAKSPEKKKILSAKILDLSKDLGVPIQSFMSTAKDLNRKPLDTMWNLLEKHTSMSIDKSQSFYVGDAAGRESGWKAGVKRDFSCSDRKFASNVGVQFYTPEEFFDKEKEVPFQWGGINPSEFLKAPKGSNNQAYQGPPETLVSKKQEMIIFVGTPASGKSSFSKTHLVPHGYVWINRDSLGTADKCLKKAKEAIGEGKSVIIDNTNPSIEARSKYIAIAKQSKVRVRCFMMTTPIHVSHHLNAFRNCLTEGKVPKIPDVAYNVYSGKYQEPKTSEGFEEIRKINFIPTFKDKKDKELFLQWMD